MNFSEPQEEKSIHQPQSTSFLYPYGYSILLFGHTLEQILSLDLSISG